MAFPRLEKNAAGDFYTTGECMFCGTPEGEAPDLFAPLEGDNFDTYFVRQPSNPDEVERACRAVTVCCVNAVRYGGFDPLIIRRLGNRGAHSDHVVSGGPIRFPRENAYSWRHVEGRKLTPLEKVLVVLDAARLRLVLGRVALSRMRRRIPVR